MKLTIYKKMMIGFLVIIILMSIANGYVLLELRNVSSTAKVTLSSDVFSIDALKKLQSYLYDEELFLQKYIISKDNAYYVLFTERTRLFNEFLGYLITAEPDDAELQQINRISDRHGSFVRMVGAVKDSVLRISAADDAGELLSLDSLRAIHASIDQLLRLNQLSIETSMGSVSTTTGRSSNIAILLTVCTVLAAVSVAFVITRTITRPISVLKRGTDQISRGIFTPVVVTTNDEFSLLTTAFNEMSEKLKNLNERKAEMMQRISHELRTPIQALLSAHFLLTEQRLGPINKEQSRILGAIRESIEKLTNFSNQFLDLAKVEAGMMEYSFQRTDLLPLIGELVNDAQLIGARKDIDVYMTWSQVGTVIGDPDKITQMVNNLLSNAIKYTPKGGTIIVNVSPSEMGVRIGVQDSGVGIAPEDLPRIFTKFFQARNVGKASAKGTGVGLALVKAFSEGHGGIVSVTSTVGIGSTFTIDLPLVPQQAGRRVRRRPLPESVEYE